MNLSLDHQERLCLIALLGTQRGTVAEMRMLWGLQDRLELSQAEKEQMEYRVATQNGMEQPSWNFERSLPYKDYEVSEAEASKIRRVVEEWPYFLTATDRKWIPHLLDQLPEAAPATTAPTPMPVRM
jgi:hypothetical protein